jgi:hypothetical protein
MAPDLLSTIRYEIDERLSELRPLLAEYERLLGAVEALEGAGMEVGSVSASEPAAPTKPDRRSSRLGARRGSAAGVIELAASGSAEERIERSVAGAPVIDETSTDEAAPEDRDPDEAATDETAETQLGVLDTAVSQLGAQSSRSTTKLKPERAPRGAAREAILAALDHGSHTVAELVVVTAMSGPNINGNLHKLVSEGAVVKTEREGKAAWALPDAVS